METGKLTNPFDALCSPGEEPFLLDVMNLLLLSNLSVSVPRVRDCKESGREVAVEPQLPRACVTHALYEGNE